jgi:hypothetical protein
MMFSGKKATFSMQNIFRIQNNDTVVMGKFFMFSGLIAILNELLVLGVGRATTGRPLHAPFLMLTVQHLESRRLGGSLRLIPTYLTSMGTVLTQEGLYVSSSRSTRVYPKYSGLTL